LIYFEQLIFKQPCNHSRRTNTGAKAMNAYLLGKAVEYHGKELFERILEQNNCRLDGPSESSEGAGGETATQSDRTIE